MNEMDPMPADDTTVRPGPSLPSVNGDGATPAARARTDTRVRSLDQLHRRRKKRTAAKRTRQPARGSRSRASGRKPVLEKAEVRPPDSWGAKLAELLQPFAPDVIRSVNDEIAARMRRIPTQLNEFGYDPWGLNVDVARRALVACTLIYRYYFRVETHGIENLPRGRVLVIGNHAGQVALDAAMIGTATFLEGNPPRILRGMGEYWLPTLPFVNVMMSRTGSVVGTPKNCVDLLDKEEAVVAFPEGVRGMNKLFRDRYRLQPFGYGFMRLALATKSPIVPVAVIGSEEQAPGLANLKSVGRLLGMPAFPITLTWPLLGPLGMIPFPVKYRIYFGKPLRFDGDPDEEDVAIGKRVDQVKEAIQSMLDSGVRARRSIFF
jgi:1-acyl-sn-glycerol-3-phosphate acyltransferase